MKQWLLQQRLIVVFFAAAAVLMYVPAIQAFSVRDMHIARSFFYGATLALMMIGLVSLALKGRKATNRVRAQIVSLVGTFVFLPVMLAIPFYEGLGTTSFLNAYFEMLSSLTTTGATVFDDVNRLAPSLHLWRAMVGWLGGFLMWLSAIAILAPLNLGGFEVTNDTEAGSGLLDYGQRMGSINPGERLLRYTAQLLPLYVGLTATIAILLIAFGDTGFVAATHAMSIMATSGISSIGGVQNASSGVLGEVVLFCGMAFAISRLTFARDTKNTTKGQWLDDPEIRLAVVLTVGLPLVLFARHFVGAFEVNEQDNFLGALTAFWGAIFTVLSFLTTTGFESASWSAARDWSGLPTPGLVLLGLAVIGGGVATTAGGVKLLRVYALYKHGLREIERLVHPSSISTTGAKSRQIRRQGAFIAWVFTMLFALSLAAVMLALSFTGLQFETAMVFSVAALANTGPLATVAAEQPLSYAGIPEAAKMVLAAAMVLGRLEALALIALLNPEFWRS